MLKVKNMTSTKGNKIANQFIISDSMIDIFQSYDSVIVKIDRLNNIISIYDNYDYSQTTGKYRNLFFNSMGFYELNSLQKLNNAIKNGCITINNTLYTVVK